jgi:hypothetical protein
MSIRLNRWTEDGLQYISGCRYSIEERRRFRDKMCKHPRPTKAQQDFAKWAMAWTPEQKSNVIEIKNHLGVVVGKINL